MQKSLRISMVAALLFVALSGCGGGGGAGVAGGGAGNGTTTIPLAPQADTFTWTGNTPLTIAAPGLLSNDPAGSAVTDTGVKATSLGGTVNLAANGNFTYTPPDGVQNITDTFTYAVAGFAPVTVSIALAERIWFVRNNNPGGTGTFLNPFPTLAQAEAASDDSDTIFVFAGDFTDTGQNQGITLKNGQKLLGIGVGLTVNNIPLVNPAPPNARISNAGLAVPGDLPVVMLAPAATAGNEVAGLTINAAFNEGILAAAGAGHAVHDNTITFDPANGREGIRLLAISGANSVVANTITNSPRSGIKFANNEDAAGNAVAAAPVTATVTMSRNTISGSAQDGIAVSLDGTGTDVTLNLLTNTISGSGQEGIDLNSLGAARITATVSRNRISGSTVEGLRMSTGGTSSLKALTVDNALSANGGNTDFRAETVAGGTGIICLELENNANVSPDSGLVGNSTFLVNNGGGAAFTFFEALNDTPAVRTGILTDVLQGACGIVPAGAELFTANCAICHTGGGLGSGRIGPDLTNKTAAAITFELTNNPTMSNIRLTGREITAIAGALAVTP